MMKAGLLILAALCNECNETRWVLFCQGVPVTHADMETKAECEALKAEIDAQTPPFYGPLKCVEVDVVRHKS